MYDEPPRSNPKKQISCVKKMVTTKIRRHTGDQKKTVGQLMSFHYQRPKQLLSALAVALKVFSSENRHQMTK